MIDLKAKPFYLNDEQIQWVEDTIAGMTLEEKLGQLKELRSVLNAPLTEINPDAHGDWLNQRRDDFTRFITMDGKKTYGLGLFSCFSRGMETARDPWSYNSSKKTLEHNFTSCIAFYNAQVEALKANPADFVQNNDETKIKWSSRLTEHLEKGDLSRPFTAACIASALYRPFYKLWVYNDKTWIHRVGQMPQIFPFNNGEENLVISTLTAVQSGFTCLMSSSICDVCLFRFGTQCFPRYLYRKVGAVETAVAAGSLMAGLEPETAATSGEVINGYERIDAIRPEAVEHFKAAYPEDAAAIDVDAVFYYIYGILHSPDYRMNYASNLQKDLPRIPRVATYDEFKAFEEAGWALAQLHVGYEQVEPYAGCTFKYAHGSSSSTMDYRVDKLKYGKIKGKNGAAATDKSVIVYNDDKSKLV